MDFTEDFLTAFNHAMLYEVGKFWDPMDPEVQAGACDTKQQRRKVGFVNIPADRGGLTKYGVAQHANPEINVRDLNLQGAMEVYFEKYWLRGACDALLFPLTVIHFDGCCNHGVTRACKFLQQAAGVYDDGIIGDETLASIEAIEPSVLIQNLSNIRSNFYNAIVERNPSQAIFLNGWMNRINEVTDFTLSNL